MFAFIVFLGVLMPIVSLVILIMMRLFDREFDVLELENVKVKLEKELQESEYKQLSERIQPHFLFNTLNAFISLNRIGRHQDLSSGMEQFALFLRYRYDDHDVLVPFRTELEHTKNYLSVQQLRFGRRLTVHYEIANDAILCVIPPYTLQTLVENAFKHGLEKKSGEKVCQIKLIREGNWVFLEVLDNGSGDVMKQNVKKGMGMENIRRRFQLIFDLPTSLTLSKTRDGYTMARAKWPYIPGDESYEYPYRG